MFFSIHTNAAVIQYFVISFMVSKKAKLHQQCTKNCTLLFNTNHKSEGKKGKARCEIIEKEYFKTILVLLK